MKTISTLIFALLLLAGFKSQTDTTAKPEKIQGIDVYVMSCTSGLQSLNRLNDIDLVKTRLYDFIRKGNTYTQVRLDC